MERRDNPEVLAVVPLPSPAERRRREIMLVRVMLVAIDLVLQARGWGWRPHATWSGKSGMRTPKLVDELW